MKVLGFDAGTAVPRYTAWKRFIEELPLHHPLGSVILTTRSAATVAPRIKTGRPPLEGSPAPAQRAPLSPDLLQCARVHLVWLTRAMSTLPHVLRLVDRERTILHIEGKGHVHDALQQIADPAPGAPSDMEAADTALTWDNCVVLPAEDGAAGSLTAIAVPLHDRDGEVIAAIDLTAAAMHAGPEHLLLLAQTAMAIEYVAEARASLPVAATADTGETGETAIQAPPVLREKDRLARLLEAVPVVVYVTDAKERILHMGGRGQADWVRGKESLVGKSLHQIFPEETARALIANNAKVRQAKTAMQFDETIEQGGRIRQYLSIKAPLRAFEDRPDAVGVIAIDVTAHRQADQKAARYSSQVSEVIDALPELFQSGSVRVVLGAVADAARRLVGGDSATASFISNGDVGRLLQATSLSGGERNASAGQDRPQIAVDGLVYHVAKPVRLTAEQAAERGAWPPSAGEERSDSAARAWLAVPLLCEQNVNAGLIQIWHAAGREFNEADEAVIAQLARLADVAINNARAHEEAKRSERRKDDFLALLGHELRNPLAPMRNATRLLGEKSPSEENILFARSIIERQVDQMTRMVDDLLDMSRIASGRFVFQKKPVRLVDAVNRAVEMCSPLFDAKRQTLSVSAPDQDLWVDADSGRLAQVLANLLNNAAKFTPEHGTVSLCLERRDAEAIVTVTDTGKGIPADMVKHIFGLFVQVDRPDAGAPGLGLGLWLARNLLELQGGTISARSEGPGSGSEFTVTLPVLATPPALLPAEAHFVSSARTDSAKGRQVLVVDDNQDSADSIAMLLTAEGYDVRVAYTGAAALQATANWSPDVVFLDIALPDMTGYAVVKKMRGRNTTKGSAMIAVTGWGRQRDREKTRAAGFDDHLVKPVDPAAVIALINSRARLVDEPET